MSELSIKKLKKCGKNLCPHKRDRYFCKECGGKGICEHNNERRRCKKCFGKDLCCHDINKRFCKPCGGSSICPHGNQKRYCKTCNGSNFCQHNLEKQFCKDCSRPQTTTSKNIPVFNYWLSDDLSEFFSDKNKNQDWTSDRVDFNSDGEDWIFESSRLDFGR
jgi:hypothetical protein